MPTLVLWGNEDRVICAGDAIRCRDFHQRAEIHVARGIGHMLPLEAPAWTNGYIARFVGSLRPARREAAWQVPRPCPKWGTAPPPCQCLPASLASLGTAS